VRRSSVSWVRPSHDLLGCYTCWCCGGWQPIMRCPASRMWGCCCVCVCLCGCVCPGRHCHWLGRRSRSNEGDLRSERARVTHTSAGSKAAQAALDACVLAHLSGRLFLGGSPLLRKAAHQQACVCAPGTRAACGGGRHTRSGWDAGLHGGVQKCRAKVVAWDVATIACTGCT
jgi:hypothetical protein